MAKRYEIWDKQKTLFYPDGSKHTKEDLFREQPVCEVAKMIISKNSDITGCFMSFTSTVNQYAERGCDFSTCVSDDDFLDAIEAFDEAEALAAAEYAAQPKADERIAAAMEFQNLMSI